MDVSARFPVMCYLWYTYQLRTQEEKAEWVIAQTLFHFIISLCMYE